MKTLLGSLITSMSGNLGGHTASSGKGGSKLRVRRIQKKSETYLQMLIRSRVLAISREWKFLSQAIRDSYNSVRIGHESTYDAYRRINFDDRGLTWRNMGAVGAETYIYGIKYMTNGIVLAGSRLHGKILRSADYGMSWTDLGQQFAQLAIYCFAYVGNGICLAGTSTFG